MRRLTFALLGLAALCACGKDIKSTTVSGTVTDAGLGASPTALYRETKNNSGFGGTVLVLISDDPNACSNLTPISTLGRTGVVDGKGGRRPSLFLNMTTEEFYRANSRVVGDDLSASFDPGDVSDSAIFCDPDAGAPAEADGGEPGTPDAGALHCATRHDIRATAGTARIEQVDDMGSSNAVATGSFDLSFPDGRLSGSFRAKPCSGLGSGCSSASGAALLPLLAVLGLLCPGLKPGAKRRKGR